MSKKQYKSVLADPPTSLVLICDVTQARIEVTICACGVLVARPLFALHGRECGVLKRRVKGNFK